MSTETKFIVVTSIAPPTEAMLQLAKGAKSPGYKLVCVGDSKSPAQYELDGCDYFSLADQKKSSFSLSERLPEGHYARKNLGYLYAIRDGATSISETDDDNVPLEGFWRLRKPLIEGRRVEEKGWVNAYRYFTDEKIWPRGFPLEQLSDQVQEGINGPRPGTAHCPVQQELANGDTDVDAVYRLTLGREVEFEPRGPLILGKGCWCPFNSQNTHWWPEAFPLLYLPSYCTFRMTDIWRSFVTQVCLWANSWNIAYTAPTMHQRRNPHALLHDFELEIPGYLNNQLITESLGRLSLSPGSDAMQDNMRRCYECLIALQVVDATEMDLLAAWFDDLNMIARKAA